MDNYIKKQIAMFASGQLKQGGMYNFQVAHDDWCLRLRGLGECNCDPDMTVFPAQTPEEFVDTYLALNGMGKVQ